MNNYWIVIALAIAIRLLILSLGYNSTNLGKSLELTSPVNNFNRINEGLFLLKQGNQRNPYAGGLYHNPPLLLYLFYPFTLFPSRALLIQLFFILLDVLNSYLLLRIGRAYYTKYPSVTLERHRTSNNSLYNSPFSSWSLDILISAVYLLNPYQLLTCLSCSTVIVNYVFILAALEAAINGYVIASAVALSAASYLNVYPLLLIPAIILLLHQAIPHKSSILAITIRFLLLLGLSLLNLFILSYLMLGSNSWLSESYLFMFSVVDCTPNIGLFWYFFTEIFQRFRLFFNLIFHGHLLIYIIPLTLRLSEEPLFLACTIQSLCNLFQAYPVYADLSMIFILFLFHIELISIKIRRIYPILILLAFSSVMFSVMCALWIYPGSGNANFAYFQSLIVIFTTAFTVIEILGAVIRTKANQTLAAKLSNNGVHKDGKQIQLQ
jgi:phosphatidylinositol glycan class U